MTREEAEKLDTISYRVATVYQWVGQLQHRHAIDDDQVTTIMDELVQLTYDIEAVSERQKREALQNTEQT